VTSLDAQSVSCQERALKGLDRLPPFSPILNRLLATVAQEDVSFAVLADLIEKDAVLAGNVLRLVNSSLYSFRGTVNSVRHAVAILGINKLRNVALGLSVSRIWAHVSTPPGWSSAQFNLHSIATGILADAIAQQTDVPYPEGGFVAGLLHDLGKLLIAIVLPAEYEAVQSRPLGTNVLDAEKAVIGETHAGLSGMVLARWNLPVPIQKAAAFHHAPELADDGSTHLAHVVRAADQWANELGHSVTGIPGEGQSSGPMLEALGITTITPALLEHFQLEFGALQDCFRT
jgi:HD-like signal output (HDOD) protein